MMKDDLSDDEPLLGLPKGMVKVTPHRNEWAALFTHEKARLKAAIGEDVLDIQHVGSTSIPGLAAKPILDIGIAVADYDEAVVCVAPLEALGYLYRGNAGIPRRHYFRRGNPCTHHIHINEINSQDWRNQIAFRDYLRQHRWALNAYASLKASLAEQYPADREAYLMGKAPFITQILALARQEQTDV